MLGTGGFAALQLWPSRGYAALTVFSRSKREEMHAKTLAAQLASVLEADIHVAARIPRGRPSQVAINQMVVDPGAAVAEQEARARDGKNVDATVARQWAELISDGGLDRVFANTQHEFDDLHKEQSKWQQIEFIKNRENGDVCLVLDTTVQICASYNAAYSEVYVHLPVAYLQSFKTALVVGGGDALALREILKYKSVTRVVQLELDERVTELCEEYFGLNAHLPGRPDTDPRVEWRFGDAAKTIVDLVQAGERFDLVLLDISETSRSGTVSTEEFFRFVAQALAPTGVMVKNEHYQQVMAKLFSEYLEVNYPLPMITSQTFVMGSNGTSLFLPNFRLFEESNVQTSFLAHGPSDQFRQLRALTRRYSKRGLNYEIEAAREFELRHERSPYAASRETEFEDLHMMREACVSGDHGADNLDVCVAQLSHPCESEASIQGDSVPQSEWTGECWEAPLTDMIEIVIVNESPASFDVSWLDPSLPADQSLGAPVLNVAQGEERRLRTFYDHQFVLTDSEGHNVRLADFTVMPQHFTHRYIVYFGLHEPLVAERPQFEEPAPGPASSPRAVDPQ